MPDGKDNSPSMRVEVKPDSVVSDGLSEVVVKCSFKDSKGKAVKEDIPVTAECRKLKYKEEKTARGGSVTFKIKPLKPTGKTKVAVSSPHGEQTAVFFVKPTPKQYVRDLLQAIVLAFIVAFGIIRPFILQTYVIPSSSMEPTIYIGDRVVGFMFTYRFREPQRGEIIVFNQDGERTPRPIPIPFLKDPKTNFIKRVVAVGGDTIEVRDLTVYVNHMPINEPYIKAPPLYNMAAVKVPEGHVFLMGDNRNNSNDSHVWGPLPLKNVRSKGWARFWPLDRIKILK
ncbi:MAG TPA: signal peptidase I [bacterium]|nr:signal peptidase I [bacterium]